MNRWARTATAAILPFLLFCCRVGPSAEETSVALSEAGGQGNSPPSRHTRERNARVALALDLQNQTDFENARRGLVARDDEVIIRDASGKTVWDTSSYAFETGAAPDSVNPSLWRQVMLNNEHGLYEVTDGVYQVRGYDLANMTIIVGDEGWIIVDPLTSFETAKAALALARKHLGDAPIKAVILTHSHIDHFGGVAAVVSAQEVASGDVRIIAPLGFAEEATSENVLAGVAMGRRASYMYGFALERGPRGHIGSGLGKEPARGTAGILIPTDIVDHTPQAMEIDGVEFIFQYVPESEAPAELTFYLPRKRVFCGAELVSRNMHNLYTLRGAKVRDALKWSGFIDEAMQEFPDVEIVFASHHWPTWGNAASMDYLGKQRDLYKFIHDQTLRMANEGLTPREIAEQIKLTPALDEAFANRGYYGTLRHNAKAVYQAYFGWYDGNPANLDPLPPVAEAEKFVQAMGGAPAVRDRATAAFDAGEYRWAATLLNKVVFANPEDSAARELLAKTYDQLGYQAESAPWRDVYLSGALELRQGVQETPINPASAMNILREMSVDRFFQAMAARIDAEAAPEEKIQINFIFTDLDRSFVLDLDRGVLHYREGEPNPNANATIRLTRELWLSLTLGQSGLAEVLFSDDLNVDGSRMALLEFFRAMDVPRGDFPIVTP